MGWKADGREKRGEVRERVRERKRLNPAEAVFGPGSLPGLDIREQRKTRLGGEGDDGRENGVIRSHPSFVKITDDSLVLDDEEGEREDNKYPVPHYTKITGWDKSNSELKSLGRQLTTKRARQESDVHVLEGVRLIKDAISQGHTPSIIVFSRVKLLWQLGLPPALPRECKLFHLPYREIKLWTDLTTSPGIMAAVPKEGLEVTARSPLPLTLICDNIRGPDNLGAVIRVAAAVGARRVVCVGCTDAWATKVLRAGAGAHFHVPVSQGVGWEGVRALLEDPWSQVVLADLPREEGEQEVVQLTREETERRVAALEQRLVEAGSEEEAREGQEGLDTVFLQPEVMELYRELPVASQDYTSFSLQPGYREVVVVLGGETEVSPAVPALQSLSLQGVSAAAYRFCHQLGGGRLHIPLR